MKKKWGLHKRRRFLSYLEKNLEVKLGESLHQNSLDTEAVA